MNIITDHVLLKDLRPEWKSTFYKEFEKPYFSSLLEFLESEYKHHRVYPPKNMLFTALNNCAPQDVRVVILGQDPYHTPGLAHGLAFSVPVGCSFPPSLRNIFKELKNDIKADAPFSGDLTHLAKQGVLLLNTTLTVRHGEAASHSNKGWEFFTDAIIEWINQNHENVVFILWGAHAKAKESLIDTNKHLILSSAHPSPLSAHRGFFGSSPFSKTNEYLILKGKKKISWAI